MKNTIIVIAFLIIITTLTVAINPQMHKPVSIGGSQIAVSNRDIIQNKDIKVANQDSIKNTNTTSIKPVEQIKNSDNISTKTIEADKNMEKLLKIQAQEDAKEKSKIAIQPIAKTTTKQPAKTVTAKKTTTTTAKPKTTTVKTPTQTTTTKPTTTTKTKTTTPTVNDQEAKKQLQKVLTEYEETILWNQWHAKVANSVADKLDPTFARIIPLGSIYRYDFVVNNNGQISNINVRLSKGYINATTNQGAVMVRNAIKSLNGNSILAFPKGTQRTTVNVSSGIQRTESSQRLNENAFSDAETIIKQMYQYK